MNRRLMSAALVLGAVGLGSAEGQTLNIPTFYMWGAYPVEDNVFYTPTTDKVRRIVQKNLNACYGSPCNQTYYRDHPDVLAEHVATEIRAELTNERLEGHTITVLIQNFGYESHLCDAVQGGTEVDLGRVPAK